MNDEMPHDDELRALYRKLPADEPRAALDDAILAAARRRNKVAVRTLTRRLRWSLPLAAAAGVVLMLTLTRLTPEQPAVDLTAAPAVTETHKQPLPPLAPQREPDGANREADTVRAEQAQPPPAATSDAKERDQYMALAQEARPPDAARKREESARAQQLESNAQRRAPDRRNLAAAAPPAAPVPRALPPSATPPVPAAPSEASRAIAGMLMSAASSQHDAWPFGLEAALPADDACRRVSSALHVTCTFRDEVAVVTLAAPAPIDRGRLAGKSVSRLTLALRNGSLRSVALQFADGTGEEVLTAPEPAK